jgi:hypothetical protein
LRKKQVEAVQYLVGSGPMHEDDCPCDDTCSCEWKQHNDAINSLVVLYLPLLAVAEAAESVAKAERDFACGRLPPPGRNERLVNLESALADFAKAREAM